MNYLQAVNRCRRECGVSGPDLVTLAAGLSREGQRFKDWINDAWRQVQMRRPDWTWMRKSVSFSTVVGQQTYTLADVGAPDLGDWVADSFRSYLTSTGIAAEMFMEWGGNYTDFRDGFLLSTMRSTPGVPRWLTTDDNHYLVLWPVPNAVYTVAGLYYRAPLDLVADTDTPTGLPERFHMLLVAKAMQAYAGFEAAPEVMERGTTMEMVEMQRLENWGLPALQLAGPL